MYTPCVENIKYFELQVPSTKAQNQFIFSDGASWQFKQIYLFSNLHNGRQTSHDKGVVGETGRTVCAGNVNPSTAEEFAIVASERNPSVRHQNDPGWIDAEVENRSIDTEHPYCPLRPGWWTCHIQGSLTDAYRSVDIDIIPFWFRCCRCNAGRKPHTRKAIFRCLLHWPNGVLHRSSEDFVTEQFIWQKKYQNRVHSERVCFCRSNQSCWHRPVYCTGAVNYKGEALCFEANVLKQLWKYLVTSSSCYFK